ncbi:hypothetical protein JCM10908_003594 [Rhodotorula pacifica]|uniref:uncharacterized protein n=1 Tax=Rhodotorula pacifica TaxID=1495444 RepID=UPI003172E75D
MDTRVDDAYWTYGGGMDDSDLAATLGGLSPATGGTSSGLTGMARPSGTLQRTVSEEVQHALGASLGYGAHAGNAAGSNVAGTSSGGRNSHSAGYSTFDPMDHARLSPSAFDPSTFSRQFTLPKFVSGGPSDPFGLGVGVTDPPSGSGFSPLPYGYDYGVSNTTPRSENPAQPSPFYTSSSNPYGAQQSYASSSIAPDNTARKQKQRQTPSSYPVSTAASSVASTSSVTYTPTMTTSSIAPSFTTSQARPPVAAQAQLYQPTSAELESPVYAPYGSSVISINPSSSTAYKMPTLSHNLPPAQPPTEVFNPTALGLPAPPAPGASSNFAGLYSASGFDMLGVLARVAARPNPQIQIGPVDSSCAFAVVDARRFDQPLVFVSDTFVKMTGYSNEEIIGRNCRFLQTPGGGTVQGAPRKYTDGNAAWHMRQHIQAGKESQSSLINYTKAGRPFINLVTIIPICWDTEEIAYFVGFQVDLVDQPNAILDRMRDGTYVVNYSLVGNAYNSAIIRNPTMPSISSATDSNKTVSMQAIEAGGLADGVADGNDDWAMADDPPEGEMQASRSTNGVPTHASAPATNGLSVPARNGSILSASYQKPSPGAQMGGAGGELSDKTDDALLDIVASRKIDALDNEIDRRAFHKFLLAQADDLVHVLSLKGSLLYCSPAVVKVLEYDASELVGATLASLCHPSDVVPVMRQLKDASTMTNSIVKLLYRVRRKHSGYVWIEAIGKLHIEPGKGRKCVIAIARPRDVMQMNWNELRQAGGLGDTEFFAKLDLRGTILTATQGTASVLGYQSQDLIGSTVLDIALPEHRQNLEIALQQAQLGAQSTLRYKVRTRRGMSEVVTKFYPRHPEVEEENAPIADRAPMHISIIAQTNEVSSEERKAHGGFSLAAPVYIPVPGQSPAVSDVDSSASGSNHSSREGSASSAAFQSTFKTLVHPSSVSDNVFDELETRRPTSWQFELHQLQNMNKKLRDEKDYLIATRRKRGSASYSDSSKSRQSGKIRRTSSETGSQASSNANRICQNCGRTDSPEWRSGPNGNKTLCNACGLRWAKSQKQGSQGSSGSPSNSPLPSPSSTIAAFGPLSLSPSNPAGAAAARPSPQSFVSSLPKVEENSYSQYSA